MHRSTHTNTNTTTVTDSDTQTETPAAQWYTDTDTDTDASDVVTPTAAVNNSGWISASDVVAPIAAVATAADGVWISCTVAEAVPATSTWQLCARERQADML